MYHEATLCNLLEVLLYHQTVCESAEDSLSELVDYCYRKLIMLNSGYLPTVCVRIRLIADLCFFRTFESQCEDEASVSDAEVISLSHTLTLSLTRNTHMFSLPLSAFSSFILALTFVFP